MQLMLWIFAALIPILLTCGVSFLSAVYFLHSMDMTLERRMDGKGTASSTVLHSLLFTQLQSESSLYMTPYSTQILSHPIAVIIIGAVEILMFLLSIASLFVQQSSGS